MIELIKVCGQTRTPITYPVHVYRGEETEYKTLALARNAMYAKGGYIKYKVRPLVTKPVEE